MFSFIEFADYVVGQFGSLCENGRIDNRRECEEAANQLNIDFGGEDAVSYYPGGCFVYEGKVVYFNTNFNGTSDNNSQPICGIGN